jgi:hypothetical protein
MSDEEYDKTNATIMKRLEWLDLQLSWTTCDATYVRYSSWAAMTLKDIRLDRAHGPQQNTGPGNKGMVSLVLCPGEPHKDRYKHTKVVGMWRHIKPFRCTTGALAMTLMAGLQSFRSQDFKDDVIQECRWRRRLVEHSSSYKVGE